MNRRIRALVALLALNCGVVVGDAHYLFDFAFYRVSGASITHTTDMEVPPILAQPVSFNFARVPITEIIEFLTEIYRLKIEVPPGLIAPWVPTKEERLIASGQPPRPLPATPPGYVTHGFVDYIEMSDVPLGQGLVAMLHPLGLGYVVEDDVVRLCKLEDSKPAANVSVYRPTPELTLFDAGALSIAGRYVPLGDAMYPTRVLEPTREIALLGGPSVSAYPGTTARIDMRDAAPVEYFEKAPGGASTFVRRLADAPTGMGIALDIDGAINGYVPSAFSLNASFVTDREPADGTALNVGKPRFLKMARNGKLSLGLNKFSAILTQFGDNSSDVLLAFVRVIEVSPPEVVSVAEKQPFSYTVEMKMIHLHGNPDWSFWTQGYGLDYSYGDGAGRVFGPVAMSAPLDNDRLGAQLGFPGTAQKDVTFIAAPRVTSYLDHKELSERGLTSLYKLVLMNRKQTVPKTITPNTDAPKAPTNISEQWNSIYDSLALQPKKFGMEDVAGKATIIAADLNINEAGDLIAAAPGKGFGTMAIVEGRSGDSPGVYRLGQTIVLREALSVKRDNPLIAQAQFACDYEIKDKSGVAFLVPVDNENFIAVVSSFQMLPPEQTLEASKIRDLDTALQHGPVIYIQPVRTQTEAPYVANVDLLRVVGRVGILSDTYFDDTQSGDSSKTYRSGDTVRAVEAGGIQIGETVVRLGVTNEPIPEELLRGSSSVSFLRVPPVPLPLGHAETNLRMWSYSPFPWVEAPGMKSASSDPAVRTSVIQPLQTTIVEMPAGRLDIDWALDGNVAIASEPASVSKRPTLIGAPVYAHFQADLNQRIAILAPLANVKGEFLVTFITFEKNE